MKVLVLSCNTGEGHNSAGLAIKEYFDGAGVECDMKDALTFCAPSVSSLVSRIHTFVYKRLPRLFSLGYGYEENHSVKLLYREFSRGAGALCEFVRGFGYDTVICVHVFASFMVSSARREHSLGVRAFFVATDYTCSPGVNRLDMDAFFIPHEMLTDEFYSKGVPRDRIVPSGIPIKKSFFTEKEKSAARERLGIPIEKKVILLSCGSMGCGPIEKVTRRLSSLLGRDEELIVICGTNAALKARLERKIKSPKVKILGYCTQMSDYMSAADVYMTKAGGLCTTEAIMCRLPLLCIDAVGGCETRNLEFMQEIGVTEISKNAKELAANAIRYVRDARLCMMLKHNMNEYFSFNATENLCKYVMSTS